MNFFEHQDRARHRSQILVMLFLLAVIAIVIAVNAVALMVFGQFETPGESVLSRTFINRHIDLLLWTSLLAVGVIGFASLYRTLALRSGGGTVARELGGTQVEPDVTDPLRRRLRNVVEEIAIAAGVPVPEIYVLEREQGINAFAAGYSPADAAVAVTRGALEHLDRAELQGVIAHEFGHVLNGDMRLNIRLIGMLFGILVLTVIGRRIIFSMRHARGRDSGGIAVLGIALLLVGYIGLFFGRWIKASVSRQREYLADASAVQFTRQPEGIAGALKKIGAAGSNLETDTEEVAHMLFARGFAQQLFATHPPLVKRIQAIEPDFDPSEFKAIHAGMQRHMQAKRAAEEETAGTKPTQRGGPGGLPLDPDSLIDQIGQPGLGQLLLATLLADSLPRTLERAAHSAEWAPEVVCYLLMDRDPDIRARQLQIVTENLGIESENQIKILLQAEPALTAELRIPLLEITYPALRQRPDAELDKLMQVVEQLIHADERVDVFEYALARLLEKYIGDARQPARSNPHGHRKLAACADAVRDLLTILAHHGHAHDPARAHAALTAGLNALDRQPVAFDQPGGDWHQRLDAALARLDGLRLDDKQHLLRAMLATITQGGETVLAEIELLRATCALLHVPLPVQES